MSVSFILCIVFEKQKYVESSPQQENNSGQIEWSKNMGIKCKRQGMRFS